VIVPTTTHFVEGFNKVVAEGVLAGRPVITSSVCPALEYVREAVIEVPPDNAVAYGDAILRLKSDAAVYESKRLGCASIRAQFYDVNLGWGRVTERAITLIQP
jgi:glycosyltransferase involved in cell wall biosynthesis